MADARFFSTPTPAPLATLAALVGAPLPTEAADRRIHDVAPLHTATASEISFFDNPKYKDAFTTTKAGACLVTAALAPLCPAGTVALVVPNPYKAYARIAQYFYPAPAATAFIHPTAIIDPTAIIGAHCHIAAGVVIGKNVQIGSSCRLNPHAVLGDGVTLGDECTVGTHASIEYAHIGHRTVIYPGARIGQPGFGFAFDPERPVKVPQLGRVIIGNDVEIGANTTVDRGAGPDTIIEDGVMIDNLVQIAHNVRIGRGSIVVAQVGISGSTEIGQYVQIGGQSGLTGHIKVGNGARIAASSGVMRDIPPGGGVGGSPAQPLKEFFRQVAYLKRAAAGKGTATE